MKYIGALLILVMLTGCDDHVFAAGHGGKYFHSGNNRIHKRLHYRIHQQHTQSYIEGGIHVVP